MVYPAGTLTFLFTDIEGSTRLWEQHPEAMSRMLARHDAILRNAIEMNKGDVFKTVGDAFCAAFAAPDDALKAALSGQQALQAQPWEEGLTIAVRMAIHTGVAEERHGDYFGQPLNRVARLLSAGHGGQILLSQAVRDELSPDLPLVDKGTHRLKDLLQPERIYQLAAPGLHSDFPPLRSLHHTNLPIQSTSFIGREREMQEVKRLLSTSRLLTLVGPGGSGKTRLALQAAAEALEDFPDGAWLVDLAPLSDPALVVQSVASALGLRDETGRSVNDTLADHLKPKSLLLLLDNCEHVVEEAARLAVMILRSCPQVTMLATSREPLNVGGEYPWRIPTLFSPEPEDLSKGDGVRDLPSLLMEYDAPRLFVERAIVQRHDFVLTRNNVPVVANLCRQLDGIPLAIELAAARVRSLSVEEISGKLDNRFKLLTGGSRTALPRQQTLRSLMDWSYDLLSTQEKALLCRLSAFSGGWTIDAAGQVCSGGSAASLNPIEDWEVLDLLASLVDKSLVVADLEGERSRYRLLETVRHYAQERLEEADKHEPAVVRAKHQAYFMSLVEEAEPHLRGPEQTTWLPRLERELDNLRAAMHFDQEVDTEHTDLHVGALRIAGGLWWLWYVRGHASEGRRWLSMVLAGTEEQTLEPERAKALLGAGVLAYSQGDFSEAKKLYHESLALRRKLGDKKNVAASLNNLGVLSYEQGDYSESRALHHESLVLRRELGDKLSIATSLNNLGLVAQAQNDTESALTYYEEGLALFEEVGDRGSIGYTLFNLGLIMYDQGQYAEARSYLERSLVQRRELGDKGGIAYSLLGLGCVTQDEDDNEVALKLLGESLALFRELDDKRGTAYVLYNLGNVAADTEEYEKAKGLYKESLVLFTDLGIKRAVVGSLEAFAALCLREGRTKAAPVLWGAAEALREDIGAPMQPRDRKSVEGFVAGARTVMEAEAFAAEWAKGRAMTIQQAVEWALSGPV